MVLDIIIRFIQNNSETLPNSYKNFLSEISKKVPVAGLLQPTHKAVKQ